MWPNEEYFLKEIHKKILTIVPSEDIELVYIKNLFLDYTKSEQFLFTKQGKLVIGKVDDKRDIIISVIKLSLIKEFKVITPTNGRIFPELVIEFEDGNSIVLNSEKDTNDTWNDKYGDYIINITRYLTALK